MPRPTKQIAQRAFLSVHAFEAAAKNGKAMELQRDLEELCRSHNQSGNDNTLSIPATYLRVTVRC